MSSSHWPDVKSRFLFDSSPLILHWLPKVGTAHNETKPQKGMEDTPSAAPLWNPMWERTYDWGAI